jgi:hypothetical protein
MIARELAQDEGYEGCSVCIADEQGNELDRVAIGPDVVKAD